MNIWNQLTEEEGRRARLLWKECVVHVAKQGYLVEPGTKADHIYVVQSGELQVVVDDYWGHRSLINTLLPGSIFGAAHAFRGGMAFPLGVVATEDSVVYTYHVPSIQASKDKVPTAYHLAMSTMFQTVCMRSTGLIQTILQVKQRTVRGKLMAYLTHRSREVGKAEFAIAHTRGQLADFLAVDRSALSREISRMQDDGLIRVSGKHFVLLCDEE